MTKKIALSAACAAFFIVSPAAHAFDLHDALSGFAHAKALAEQVYGQQNSGSYASQSQRNSGAPINVSGLPNPNLTPGATNPAVTQATIHQTICVRGYTRTIRPPVSYTERLKREQIRQYGYSDLRMSHYEEDHLVSLELGGSPSSPRNLWPEPHNVSNGWGSFVKDKLENKLRRMVCRGQITLRDAQYQESHDWIAAYKRYIGPRP